MESSRGTLPLCLQTSLPCWSNRINVGTSPPLYICRIRFPTSEVTLSRITMNWSCSWASSLSTSGLAERQAIQRLEYNSRSTGFPALRTLLKSFGVEILLELVLAINWNPTKDTNAIANVTAAHLYPNNCHVITGTNTRMNNPTKIKEYWLINIAITVLLLLGRHQLQTA